MKKFFWLAPVLALCFVACGVAQWIKSAQQLLPVVLPMVTNLVTAATMLEGKTITAAQLSIVNSTTSQASRDLALAGKLVSEYQATPSPTTLDKINNALSDVNSNLNQLLPAAHITDEATVEKIQEVVSLIVNEVEAVQQILPVLKTRAQAARAPSAILSAKRLKQMYKSIIAQSSGNVVVDAAFAKAAK